MTDSEGCLASWGASEKWCDLACAASVLANRWHPVVVDRLLGDGPLGFNALQDAVGGVASNVLSDSLDSLVDDGVVERTVVSEKPYRVEYALTERGEDLEPVVDALREWGRTHDVSAPE